MSMIEVDPKLFITCRLCLDELGVYQIVPSVQEQIKFCFDINVHSFDGLPQLLCKKCEGILSEFSKHKKIFQEKQNALHDKVQGEKSKDKNKLEPIETLIDKSEQFVSSSQQHDETAESELATNSGTKQKSTPEPTDPIEAEKQSVTPVPEQVNPTKLVLKLSKKRKTKPWQVGLLKLFYCKVCGKNFKSKSNMNRHLRVHENFMQKYKDAFKKCCNVSIEKFDDKPNRTGSLKTIVWDDKTIVQNMINKHYFIKFTATETNVQKQSNEPSSDEEFVVRKSNSKRRRIFSSDTLVLDEDLIKNESDKEASIEQKMAPDVSECIDIIDSSDNESTKSIAPNKKTKIQSSESHTPDYKSIQSIISMCYNKYMKKVESEESNTKAKQPANVESLLKHKILSIGRKIINKQGFNCNGILRFMDYKNLDIDWTHISGNPQENNNHIRIITQLRSLKKNADNNGWKKMSDFLAEQIEPIKVVQTEIVKKGKSNADAKSQNVQANEHEKAVDKVVLRKVSEPENSSGLFIEIDGRQNLQKILLNENPVANPKQLPKKRDMMISDQNYIEVPAFDHNQVPAIVNENSETCMPIITSTTSLAFETGKSKKNAAVDGGNTTKPVAKPRIKVKPASELMAPKGWNQSNFPHQGSVGNMQVPIRVTGTVPQYILEVTNTPTRPLAPNNDLIMLHTIELPHCKTDSPFRYFQNLLQIHSIVLLECNTLLSSHFKCLIRFKVHYAEEAKDHPIVLCSALMCFENQFCIKIRDAKQEEIDITKLSANWQWEILKTFRSDVATKMWENALKLGREIHSNTNTFIRFLKSIEMKKMNA